MHALGLLAALEGGGLLGAEVGLDLAGPRRKNALVHPDQQLLVLHEHLQQPQLVDHAELLPVGDAVEVLGLVAVDLALGHFLPDGLNAVHEPVLELVVHPLLRSPPAVLEEAQPLLDGVVVALGRLVFAGFVGLG